MKLGIFGGSFDPIHMAHLWMAEAAVEQLQLDEVRFIVAAQSPLKQDTPPIDPKHRVQMVRLAIGGNPKFQLDDREIQRTGVSYTVETLQQIADEQLAANIDTELFLIIGSDSLITFHRWHQPSKICELATIAVVHRGGLVAPELLLLEDLATPKQLAAARKSVIQMPLIQLSSSEIRSRVAAEKSIRYRVPAAVAAYISENKLYSTPIPALLRDDAKVIRSIDVGE